MLEKNGNFRFSYPQTPKYWQKQLPIKLETWASFVCTQSLGFINHLYIHSLYTSIILKKIMNDYAMISPTRSRKYFLPCLSIMSPISGSETGPAGYDAAEGQVLLPRKKYREWQWVRKPDSSETYTKSKISSDQAQSNADDDSHTSEVILWREIGRSHQCNIW